MLSPHHGKVAICGLHIGLGRSVAGGAGSGHALLGLAS